MTAALYDTQYKDHTTHTEWAMEYFMYDIDSEYHMAIMRSISCSFVEVSLGCWCIATPGEGALSACPNKGVGGVTNRLEGPTCQIFDNDVFPKC